MLSNIVYFFFSSRRRHTRSKRDWSSDVCSSDLDCRGLVLLSPVRSEQYRVLTVCDSIVAEDERHAAELREVLDHPRSEERRVGKECRSWWRPSDEKEIREQDRCTSGRRESSRG